jgi:hypothetical protein
MSADKFGLFFRAPKRTDQLPRTPIANIYVKSYLNTEYNAKDLPLITPDCITIGELDEWISSLIRDLETVRLEARRKFAPYDKAAQIKSGRDRRRGRLDDRPVRGA